MNVTSIRYQPVEGGALGGHFALHVSIGPSLTAGAGVSFTPTALATRIHEAFDKLDLKSPVRGVLLDCRDAVGPVDEMLSLLGTLRDWKYQIVLWVSENTRHPWFEYASYITVFVTSKNWPNFRANEIRFVIEDKTVPSPLEEPEVFEVNAQAACYLYPKVVRASTLLAFITGCKRAWGIILPVTKTPAIDFNLERR